MNPTLKSLKSASPLLVDDSISLQTIDSSNISSAYVDWMNDQGVVRFTEQRFAITTKPNIRSYLQKMDKSLSDLLYGIYEHGTHIGTIKLGAINPWHKTATLSYLIGSKEHWGKGIASRVISKMTDIGFGELELEKISASVYVNNKASARVLEKNEFQLEGVKTAQYLFEGQRVDALLYAKICMNQ